MKGIYGQGAGPARRNRTKKRQGAPCLLTPRPDYFGALAAGLSALAWTGCALALACWPPALTVLSCAPAAAVVASALTAGLTALASDGTDLADAAGVAAAAGAGARLKLNPPWKIQKMPN